MGLKEKMKKCNEIEDISKRNECKIKILEEELIVVKKKVYPMEDLVDAIKDYAEPKFNALGVRMGNVETIMANTDTKITNLDTKITNLDTKITNLDTKITNVDTKITNADTKITNVDTKITNVDMRMTKLEIEVSEGFKDLKKGQIKIAKEPAESLYK